MYEMPGPDNSRKSVLKRTSKKISLVVLLIILIEVLYLHVDGTSWRAGDSICYAFGFPFRSVHYGMVTGEKGQISENERVFGLKADPALFCIDILVVLFLGIMLVRCVPTFTLVPVVKGCVLGSVTGGALSCLNEVSSESWISGAVMVVVIFALVPFAIYMLSIGHKWQKTTIIVISAVTVFTFWRSFLLVDGLFDGFMEDDVSLDLSMLLRLIAIQAVPVCECLVIMLLHRKVLPASWRKRRPNYPPTVTKQKSVADSAMHSDRAWGGRLIWGAVVYLVLLAVLLYVGFHFWTLREIRNDFSYVADAIWCELERQEISLDVWHTQSWPDSAEVGWNASFDVVICSDGADRYHARMNKHILIPRIQVDLEEIKAGDQSVEDQNSN
jgi:hypothetical protein